MLTTVCLSGKPSQKDRLSGLKQNICKGYTNVAAQDIMKDRQTEKQSFILQS